MTRTGTDTPHAFALGQALGAISSPAQTNRGNVWSHPREIPGIAPSSLADRGWRSGSQFSLQAVEIQSTVPSD